MSFLMTSEQCYNCEGSFTNSCTSNALFVSQVRVLNDAAYRSIFNGVMGSNSPETSSKILWPFWRVCGSKMHHLQCNFLGVIPLDDLLVRVQPFRTHSEPSAYSRGIYVCLIKVWPSSSVRWRWKTRYASIKPDRWSEDSKDGRVRCWRFIEEDSNFDVKIPWQCCRGCLWFVH